MKTKKYIGLIAAALSVMMLAGCNQNNNPAAPGALNTDQTESGSTDNPENSGEASQSAPADTQGSGNSSAQGDYSAVEVKTPDDFKGNSEEVTLEKGDTYAIIKIKDYGEIKCKLFSEAAPKGVQNFIDTANSGFYTNKLVHRVVKDFMMQGGSANGDGLSTSDEPKFGVEYNKNMRHFYGALCYANAGGVNGTQFYIVNSKTCDLSAAGTAADYDNALKQIDDNIKELNELINTAEESNKAYYQQYLDYYIALKGTYEYNKLALEQRTEEMEKKYNEVGGTPFLDGGYTVFGQAVEGFDVIDKISEVEVELQPGSEEVSHPVTDIVIESVTIGTVE